MNKKQLTAEQKRLDVDLWIILLVTVGVFVAYASLGRQIIGIVTDQSFSIVFRLLLLACIQFGVAGLGITLVCILRRERFAAFGLTARNMGKAIIGTILCFVPLIGSIFISGQFGGYHPFHQILLFDEVLSKGLPFSIFGVVLMAVVWGFFEGFNYVVIGDKVNRRYPRKNRWLNYGAIVCAIACLLFHPISISFWGVIQLVATFIAIYGMLIVKEKTGNAWGCVFAFLFIWNAL